MLSPCCGFDSRRLHPEKPGNLTGRERIAVITAEPSLGEAIRARVPRAFVLSVPACPSEARRAALRQKARQVALAADVVVGMGARMAQRSIEPMVVSERPVTGPSSSLSLREDGMRPLP